MMNEKFTLKELDIQHDFILTLKEISKKALDAILQIIDEDEVAKTKKKFKIDIQAWLIDDAHDEAWVKKMMKQIYK